MPDALQCIATLVKISNKFDHILVGYVKKTAQKQPIIVLSAGMKTFEISKLENYKSDISEFWPRYHLSTFNIPKPESVNEWAGGVCNQKATRKCPKIKRIFTFASSKTNSNNAKEKGIFSLPSITI